MDISSSWISSHFCSSSNSSINYIITSAKLYRCYTNSSTSWLCFPPKNILLSTIFHKFKHIFSTLYSLLLFYPILSFAFFPFIFHLLYSFEEILHNYNHIFVFSNEKEGNFVFYLTRCNYLGNQLKLIKTSSKYFTLPSRKVDPSCFSKLLCLALFTFVSSNCLFLGNHIEK